MVDMAFYIFCILLLLCNFPSLAQIEKVGHKLSPAITDEHFYTFNTRSEDKIILPGSDKMDWLQGVELAFKNVRKVLLLKESGKPDIPYNNEIKLFKRRSYRWMKNSQSEKAFMNKSLCVS